MVSLWGSKNGGEEDEQDHEESPPRASSADGDQPREQQRSTPPPKRAPDERTRLLQSRQNDGFLSPDDPAVSPYNLWSVRALRYFAVLFLMISFLWWTLLLVSIFVTPPYLETRGSGFFDFAYTSLTIGNILVSLLFFATPSTPMGVLSMSVSVLLIIDMIIILAVGRLRSEEGWVGIASVVWAAFIGLYNVLSNRTVRWGKKEEEERLTGRAETRRSFKEWIAVFLATIIMAVMVVVAVLLTATLVLRARDASLPAPGELYLVDGNKYRIHMACVGNQTYSENGKRNPTVILEAGEYPVEGTFEDWVYNAYKNGSIDRYCYWDRPGVAWSETAPSPHSAGMSVDALSEALAIAGEQGPWIVMGAGIGGIYSRIFASRHVRDVKGIFLIDAMQEDLLYKVGNPGRGFMLWARGIISPLGLDRLAGALFKGRTREDRVYGRVSYQGGKFIKYQLQENLVANSLTKSEVVSARNIQSQKTPLVVVSSGIEVRRNKDWEEKQEALTRITNNLISFDVVNKAPHEVWQTAKGREVLERRLAELYTLTLPK